jgi:hypothetical protein
MRKLSALVVLIAAALGVGLSHAQAPAPMAVARTVKAVQPGLLEATGPRVSEALAAGLTKVTATPGKGGKSIYAESPWGPIYFDWPKDVKQVAFTVETTGKDSATISAPGFTEANKAEYRAAFDAVVPLAISKAKAQKEGKTKG